MYIYIVQKLGYLLSREELHNGLKALSLSALLLNFNGQGTVQEVTKKSQYLSPK